MVPAGCLAKLRAMAEPPQWLRDRPPDSVLRSPPTRAEQAAEQDDAAGGRERRQVYHPDGRASTASIYLHRVSGRRVWAYLRFKTGGRTIRRYVGDATAPTREGALRRAWGEAFRKRLL